MDGLRSEEVGEDEELEHVGLLEEIPNNSLCEELEMKSVCDLCTNDVPVGRFATATAAASPFAAAAVDVCLHCGDRLSTIHVLLGRCLET